ARRRYRAAVLLGWLACLVATAAELLLIGPRAHGAGWSGVVRCTGLGAAATGHIGLVLIVRLAVVAVLAGLAGRGRATTSTAMALGCAALATVALTGHEAVGPLVWPATGSAMVHLAAMAIWLGGLALLAATGHRPRSWSRVAFGCVAALI